MGEKSRTGDREFGRGVEVLFFERTVEGQARRSLFVNHDFCQSQRMELSHQDFVLRIILGESPLKYDLSIGRNWNTIDRAKSKKIDRGGPRLANC
jgi:hypothetical protein